MEHINWMGTLEWRKTATKLRGVNAMRADAFTSVAGFLEKNEQDDEDWHLAPIWGHSLTHKLFPFYPADIASL
jgi:hypothetical protein